VDAAGSAYVTGSTSSTDFPTANPYQATKAGEFDAFVAKLNSSGNALVYSTYLGGSFRSDVGTPSSSSGQSIATDGAGNAYVAGYTFAVNFPTVNPIQAWPGYDCYNGFGHSVGCAHVFVSRVTATGSGLAYSTYLGGPGQNSAGYGITVDSSGSAYVTGSTAAAGFPTRNAFQPALSPGRCPDLDVTRPCTDAFVAKIILAPNLAITNTDSPDPVLVGATLTYTLTVTNSGDIPATGVTISDPLPASAAFQSVSAPAGVSYHAGRGHHGHRLLHREHRPGGWHRYGRHRRAPRRHGNAHEHRHRQQQRSGLQPGQQLSHPDHYRQHP
jgi:uncharacterized repeat protein (TIGR01451 family)